MIDLAFETRSFLARFQSSLTSRLRHACLWAGLGAISLPLATAHAQAEQKSPRAHARELGQQGLSELDDKAYDAAEEHLSEAIALYPAPTLYVARSRAREAQGKLVAAAQDLRTVTQMPPVANEPAAYAAARTAAKQQLSALEARAGRLIVVVDGGPAEVTVNGTPWPTSALGQPVPVDPGLYRAQGASERGKQEVEVQVAEGQAAELRLSFAAVAEPSADTDGGGAGAAPIAPPQAPPQPGSLPGPPLPLPLEHTGPGMGAYVAGTLTLAAAVATGITGVLYLNQSDDYDEINGSDDSTQKQKEDARATANTTGWISTGFGIAAGVGAALTTWLFLSDSGQGDEEPATGVSASMGPTGVTLQGRF